MDLLKDYLKTKQKLFDYFGYKEGWVVIPVDDATGYVWKLKGTSYNGKVCFADTLQELNSEDGNYYENEIYTQRFLDKWVYRGKDFTMICVDTHTDGNKFLQIFSNDKEIS